MESPDSGKFTPRGESSRSPFQLKGLTADNEGLDGRNQSGYGSFHHELDAVSTDEEKDDTIDGQIEMKQDDLAGRGMHLVHQPSNRTVSSIGSTSGGPGPLEKKQSNRSSVSLASVSECHDESAYSIYGTPRQSRNLQKENSAKSFLMGGSGKDTPFSPRSRRGRATLLSRRPANLSTREEEDAALMELYGIIGEENRDRLEFKRNEAGFMVLIELLDTPIDGAFKIIQQRTF